MASPMIPSEHPEKYQDHFSFPPRHNPVFDHAHTLNKNEPILPRIFHMYKSRFSSDLRPDSNIVKLYAPVTTHSFTTLFGVTLTPVTQTSNNFDFKSSRL